MRGLSQLSWYLQRLPWALDKTYLGSRLQALAEGRSNVLRGCTGYATNTMSGQEQEVGPVCPACEHVALPATCSVCGVVAVQLSCTGYLARLLRRCCMKWGPPVPWPQ